MRNRIKNHIENCTVCMTANTPTNTERGELQITDTPEIPFHLIHVDHFDPLIKSSEGFKYIFVVVDTFTRFT